MASAVSRIVRYSEQGELAVIYVQGRQSITVAVPCAVVLLCLAASCSPVSALSIEYHLKACWTPHTIDFATLRGF